MERRGRKPQPTNLALLKGGRTLKAKTPRPKKSQVKELSSRVPGHLPREAKRFWRYFYDLLNSTKILTILDAKALEMLAREWANYISAQKDLDENGKMLESNAGGKYWNPSWAQYKHSQKQVMTLLSEFGMTPTARTRIESDLTKTDDEWEEF